MLSAVLAMAAVAAGPASEGQCRVLVRPKHAGEPVYSDDITSAACAEQQPQALLRYDRRRHIVVARQDLGAGTDLGRAFVTRRPAVAAGEKVNLTVVIGHVRISRTAEALQSARPGERFFVRAENGEIFAAPAIRAEPGKGEER